MIDKVKALRHGVVIPIFKGTTERERFVSPSSPNFEDILRAALVGEDWAYVPKPGENRAPFAQSQKQKRV